jgi:serine/threonine protein kinase
MKSFEDFRHCQQEPVMVGQSVSHYQILCAVGSGGMSVVYKARDARLDRHVALKFLRERFCKQRGAVSLFRHEARIASGLNHPGICTIYDIDQISDRPFIVMEYLDGMTLRDRLQLQCLTTAEAVTCAMHIADALAHAHAAGVVHRDINPANLFITRQGHVKLLDFGIAQRQRDGSRTPTGMETRSTGTLTGTTHYMSPEQAMCFDVDERSDIFSTGVVLYEMLSGRRPFAGPDPAATIQQIISGRPYPLRPVVDVRPEIEEIVWRCLEKRPDRRYSTASSLKLALKSAAAEAGLPSEVVPLPASEIATKGTTEYTLPYCSGGPRSASAIARSL